MRRCALLLFSLGAQTIDRDIFRSEFCGDRGYSAPRLGILAYCWPGGARRFAVGASTRYRIGSYVGCTATPVRKHCGLNLWRQYGGFIPGSACRRANCRSIRITDCTHKHCGFSAPGGHNLLPHSSGAEN